MIRTEGPVSRVPLTFTLLLVLVASTALGQEILLDRQARCGEMLCYQSLDDPLVYHYLPDSPRLATKNGKPQFSFLEVTPAPRRPARPGSRVLKVAASSTSW